MIVQNNNSYSIGNVTGTYDKLPLGSYRLRYNTMTDSFYLIKAEDFILPTKLYGDFSLCDRVINTFNHTERNLGVLLTGERGSGKTITAKKICINANMPVIIIDKGFTETEILNFFGNPSLGSCVVLIDEFEKLYTQDTTIILQLLDGISTSHHLFLLTCNKSSAINKYLLNRPSRIYYYKEYGSVPEDIIEEILNDELINKEFKSDFKQALDKFNIVTFDILMSLLKEVNLYNESPLECAKLMSFVPDPTYIEVLQYFGKDICLNATCDSYFERNSTELEVRDYTPIEGKELNEHDFRYYFIKRKDFVRINKNTWEYNKDGRHYLIKRKTFKSLLF